MAVDREKLKEFVNRAVADLGAGMSAALVLLGDRLGLYRAMAGAGPLTPASFPAGPARPSATSASGCSTRRPAAM